MTRDDQLDRLEALVLLQLCKCQIGQTSYVTTGCPLHDGVLVGPQKIWADRNLWRSRLTFADTNG